MDVDPAILRTFANEADEAAGSIRAADLPGKLAASFDAVEGSAVQWMVKQMAPLLATPLNNFTDGIAAMKISVATVANTFQVSDEELAAQFNNIHVGNASGKN
ncbi:hypothetical protein [Nocardia sp. SSK8]|uniref:hypothetical protein n=1 Tax=Nocardia sp. SSK8 TaxID=3120154 RepID=UPI0030080461